MIRNAVRVRAGFAWCAVAMASVLAGCQATAPVLDPLFGNPGVEAKHHPANVKTLVFIDDPSQRLPNIPIGGMISERIGRDLKANEVVTEVVEPRKLDELRLNQPDFHNWAIDRVGQSLGAKQVIYVLIDSFAIGSFAEHGDLAKPVAYVRVKIVDVESGRRVFPADSPAGYGVSCQLAYKQAVDNERGTRQVLERTLADRIGEDVAKLFYDHKPRDMGDPLPE